MADDRTQRPYRANEPPVRSAPATSPVSSGSDPLAELARLIGQNDPFAEFGRDGARRAGAPAPVAAAPAQNFGTSDYYDAVPAAQQPVQHAGPYVAPNRTRQPYSADLYHPENAAPRYPGTQIGDYEADPYQQNTMHQSEQQEDIYDDAPTPRRRKGVMVITTVFALAVIGTAGAFGYRSLFGSSGSSQPPPVIKADTAPSKIVPAATTNKQMYDRVADRGQSEKLVSREEQPMEMKDKPATVVLSQGPQAIPQPAATLGSGVIGSEPKKIRTIAIRPDQAGIADSQPVTANPAAPAPPPPRVVAAPVRAAAAPPPPPPPSRVASNPPAEANPEPQQPEPRAVQPVRQAAAPAPSNAPLSLSPDAPPATPAPAARPPVRTAAAAAPAQIAPQARAAAAPAAGGGYAVQVSSQRSEAEAQAAFQSLQAKYPSQLGGKQALIRKVELGEKGTYYRALVGPFGDANAANELCSGLKAAGGACLVQRN